jgi:hypothetical protein
LCAIKIRTKPHIGGERGWGRKLEAKLAGEVVEVEFEGNLYDDK